MTIDATFWVAVSFFIFLGGLIYLKVPQKINTALNNQIEQMKKDAEEHAEEDKKQFEAAETRNMGENLVYAAEKLIKENPDKIPDDKKKATEAEADELKEALKGDDLEKIKSHTDKLQEALQAASADMYKAAAEEAQQQNASAEDGKKEDDSL